MTMRALASSDFRYSSVPIELPVQHIDRRHALFFGNSAEWTPEEWEVQLLFSLDSSKIV
jgi:hypothetical protein